MNIGTRLNQLRTAKGMSQGDIEKLTGLLRCYISRVENGHTVPSLGTLERMAKALEIEVYQLFFEGEGKPVPVAVGATEVRDVKERELVKLFRQIDNKDKQLVLRLARDLASRPGKHTKN